MLERNLRQIWEQLRAKRRQLDHFLEEVRLRGELRGIRDLRVPLTYPVSVLAGQNGCGKSTVLFALACAYKVPGAGVKEFTPSSLIPDFKPTNAELPGDTPGNIRLSYSYLHAGERLTMDWARTRRGWGRSFRGQPGASQPEGPVYLRKLRDLSNPSEIRSVLQLSRATLTAGNVDATLLTFAHQVLPFKYVRLVSLSGRNKDLLFAEREDHGRYSEFHMSAGERAILRLSRDVSGLRRALVLIDEIEAGLHPLVQQQLMLQLQRIALRNELQVVVTTHSPAVLDSVPAEARIFLERTVDNVEQRPAFRDVIQKAFYGRSFDELSVLCEDESAESVLRGLFDELKPRLGLVDDDIEVGRDTGKTEFPAHVRALARIGRLDAFVFVLDGDGRDHEAAVKQAASSEGQAIALLFLPGQNGPEDWVWSRLTSSIDRYAEAFAVAGESFRTQIEEIDRLFATAADTPANKAKGRLEALAAFLKRPGAEVCRHVARAEYLARLPEAVEFAQQLEERVQAWRSMRA